MAAGLSQAAATADVMAALTEQCEEGCPISCNLLGANKSAASGAEPSASLEASLSK